MIVVRRVPGAPGLAGFARPGTGYVRCVRDRYCPFSSSFRLTRRGCAPCPGLATAASPGAPGRLYSRWGWHSHQDKCRSCKLVMLMMKDTGLVIAKETLSLLSRECEQIFDTQKRLPDFVFRRPF